MSSEIDEKLIIPLHIHLHLLRDSRTHPNLSLITRFHCTSYSIADKTEQDSEREQSLVDQWVSLTEERNAVLVPTSGSGIPGAPADWDPPPGMEPHIPVLFLDLNADDLSSHGNQWQNDMEELPVTGLNSILPKEHGNKFYNLPIIRHCEKDVSAVAAWDSSVHDTVHLNKATDRRQ
ncbi:hypothetical protein LSTR_LSTR015231 [Laodelphax striatellus]|uniref:Uncharacterized protein n=1 Tax=Laodelphax striatellus TaxID=195883 RepID=A0A482X885_LAOST|nr:hypothetical protein LSTR_LSTR015231 [Laodelphax striatellus]